ncbi:MAG: TPM domain-containing protein [Microcoleaceae cyanobacterium]
MKREWFRRFCVSIVAVSFGLLSWAIAPNAYAFDNPELLPEVQTAVVDLAEILTGTQEHALSQELEAFEQETGWRLRVLTQFDQTPGRAVKDYWDLNNKSVLLVADQRGGNILNFNVGRELYALLSRTFWVELQTRYGNQFFVRDNGEDQSIIQSLNAVKFCLLQGGCRVVPGLPREQWILTLITSALGGLICGVAAVPRKSGQLVAWQWALIFSPLWGILFIAFGIGPVISRTTDWVPLTRNIAAFLICALAAYLAPMFSQSSASET